MSDHPRSDNATIPQTGPDAQRPTIALLGSPMFSGQSLWLGVADAALALDINLICFLGGAVMTGELETTVLYGIGSVESAALLYDLVTPETVDGLVTWAGSGAGLGIHLNEAEMDDFFARYRPLPIVNYEKVVPGIPTVLTDTYRGMCQLLRHVIEDHRRRRIAIMRGPDGHFETDERLRAYRDTLAEYGLRYDPNLVCPPAGWGVDHGAAMMNLLLDERKLRPGLDFDVLASTEAQYAVGAMGVLRARGVHVPDEVAVIAYNDMNEARATVPPLTVARKSFYDAGWKALESALKLVQGESLPEQIFVPSELTLRRSCGCWPADLQTIAVQPSPLSEPDEHLSPVENQRRAGIIALITRKLDPMVANGQAANHATNLLDAWIEELTREPADLADSRHVFLSTLENVLHETRLETGDTHRWHTVLSTLQNAAQSAYADDTGVPSRAEVLCQQARILVEREGQRRELDDNLGTVMDVLTLREIGQQLICTFNLAELMDAIAREIPRLGIPSCYLSLYEDPQPYQYGQSVPEWSRLMLAFNEHGRVDLGPNGQRFRSRQLVPDGFLSQDRAIALVAVPLYFGQQAFGFALLEIGPREGIVYTELWQLISSALQVVLLFEDQKRAEEQRLRLRLEQERMRILTNFITKASHEFRTPLSIINNGIYLINRIADPDRQQQQLAMMKDQVDHITELVDNLATVTRLDGGVEFSQETTQINELVSVLVSELRPETDRKNHSVNLSLQDDLPLVVGEADYLKLALRNVVLNALHYTPEDGVVTLSTHATEGTVVIEVQDTGSGISEEEQHHIFERFYRVDQAHSTRGFGLGLPISQKIIEGHGGKIEVDSQPGQGSTFRIIMPVANTKIPANEIG